MQRKIKRAFSLIELSIVIVIISIFAAGTLSYLTNNSNNEKMLITEYRMRELYKTLGRYLLSIGKLPCPASLSKIITVDSDYGSEIGSGSNCDGAGVYANGSNLVYGMFPTKAIAIASEFAEDGFGNRFTYIVDKRFANTAADFEANGGTITVQNKLTDGTTSTAVTDAIFVIISHGPNKAGAFNSKSSSQNTRSSDADEMNNDATTFNVGAKTATFDNTIIASSGASTAFDDIVFYKTRNQIVADFNAFHLFHCGGGAALGYTWPTAEYGQVVQATTNCATHAGTLIKPTRSCGLFGEWGVIVNPCT